MRPQRPCLGLPGQPCGSLTRNPGGRCRPCELAHQKARNQNPRRQALYGGNWQTTRQQMRQTEPWCHCDLPGHGHDGQICNRVDDLTLDHQHGRVECRSCNSSHRRNH